MMDLSQRKEQWSRVYVRAVATAAGYTVYMPEVDDDSVDLGIAGRMVEDLPRPPRIELQLKASSEVKVRDDHFVYRLKRKNYDDLRYIGTDLLVPRLLVVVLIPALEADWMSQSEEELVIRRCGYWVNLQGCKPTASLGKVSVHVPRANVLTVESLRGLMRRAARKEPL
jgi:hypothetical protein